MKGIQRYKLAFAIMILLVAQALNAQIPMPFLNPTYLQEIETTLLKDENQDVHTAIKPYNHFEIGNIADSLHQELRIEKEINKKFARWAFNAFLNDHFLEVKDDKFALIVNPLMDIKGGTSSDLDNVPFVNSRGVQIMGRIGRNLTFYTDLYENQARFPGYVNSYISKNLVVPGEGLPKAFNSQFSDTKSFDFSYATGNISYQPNEFFNFQFGHGKHFIGEGHRSLFLSDNAFNYPYLKIKTAFWKLNYVNLFTQMRDLVQNNSTNKLEFHKKYVSAHYLSINATKKFNIGLFEAVVYQDSTEQLDINYLNPVILYRPVEFAVGSRSGNVLIGISMSYKIRGKMMLYGQMMIDEFKFSEVFKGDGWWANKYAFQLGFKSYDTFTKGLKFQTEMNYARPFTYAHKTSGRSYGHYNQPIAHPLGANFIESVSSLNYHKGRWFGELELMYAVQGLDSLGTNVGTDVFLSYETRDGDDNHRTLQGIKATTMYANLRVGYLVNPKNNFRVELGMTYRQFDPEIETADVEKRNTTYIHFGIRTALNNKYYDF